MGDGLALRRPRPIEVVPFALALGALPCVLVSACAPGSASERLKEDAGSPIASAVVPMPDAATLDAAERRSLLAAVRSAVPAATPVIAGVGAPTGRQAAAFTTRQGANQFLLIRAFEIEAANIGARLNFSFADGDNVGTAGNGLPNVLIGD